MTKLILPICIFLLISCESTDEEKVDKKEVSSVELNQNYYNVAFLVMDGTFNTELTAPYDVFHHTRYRDSIKAMNVFTVANTSSPITTFEGLKILPDFNYLVDDLPLIDVLIIPSAEHHLDTDLEDQKMLEFVQRISSKALFTISHCDGAFVLAKAGILKNKSCTTFPGDIAKMKEMFPSLEILENVVFVHDGNVITSSGGAKSFEASLYLCELLYGKKNADEIAEGMVINWDLSICPHLIVNRN